MGQQIEELARFVAGTPWTEIPGPVQHRAKLVLLDTLGVILAGAGRPEVRALWERLSGTAGTGATVPGEFVATATHSAVPSAIVPPQLFIGTVTNAPGAVVLETVYVPQHNQEEACVVGVGAGIRPQSNSEPFVSVPAGR